MVTYKYSGQAAYAGLGVEATEGTAVEPTLYVPYEDFSSDDNPTIVFPKVHVGTLDGTLGAVRTAAEGKCGFKIDAIPEMGLEYFLLSAFGTAASAFPLGVTGGCKEHIFDQANSSKSYTIHSGLTLDVGDVRTNKPVPRVYRNAILDSFKFSIKEKEAAKLDVDFVTAPVLLNTTAPTPTYTSVATPFVFPELKFKMVDAPSTTPVQDTMIQDFSFEIKKAVKTEFTANNNLGPSIFAPSGFDVTGKFSKIFQDMDEYKKFLGSATATEFANTMMYKNVEVELAGKPITGVVGTATNYNMKFIFPKILVTKNDPKWTGEDIVKYDFDFLAMRDPTAGKTMQAKVTSALLALT